MILGVGLPEGATGHNLGRNAALRAGFPLRVPGATINLKGTYGVEGGALDFAGTTKLDATVSQMVGGVLGALLKPADRLFRKDGAGTEVPIHISGTREDPKFGIDFGRMRGKQQPSSQDGKP